MSFPTQPRSLPQRSSNPLSPSTLTHAKQPSADSDDGISHVHSKSSSPLGDKLTGRTSKVDRTRRSHRADASALSSSRSSSAEREQATPFEAARASYGTTLAKLKALPGAFYAPSASAGLVLNGLNDHDGVLIVPARDGQSTVAERFAVVKQDVGGEDRYFIKGHGDFAVPFEDFERVLREVNARDETQTANHMKGLKKELQTALDAKPWEDPLLETPLRSEVLALSTRSELSFRRNEKESDDVLMPKPLNPTPFPKKVSWANSENALCPGCGPVLKNGTRLYQLDWNRVENRLMGFRNNNGEVDRNDAIMADTVPGQKAPVLVDGPVMFELAGIKRWQLMGPPEEQSGVKGGTVGRLAAAADNAAKWATGNTGTQGTAADLDGAMHKLRPGAHIRITTEDGAVHDLKLTEKGMSLALATTTAGLAGGDHKAALGVGMEVDSATPRVAADVNVYSYKGNYTGRHSTPGGLPDPHLVLSTGEALKAGPLMNQTNDWFGAAQAMGRLVTYQPKLGGPGAGARARLVNVLILALAKFGTTALSAMADHAMRGEDGLHVKGAVKFSGVGSGEASTGKLAGSAALIVLSQELVTALKDAILPAIPEGWQHPSSDMARNALTLVGTAFEEMLRLEINLGLQKALGLREGAAWDHGTIAISSGLKAVLETVRGNIGGPEANPTAHMILDAAQSLQYMMLRVTGMVLSEPSSHESAGQLGLNFQEAARARANLRVYDQMLAPLFGHVLNRLGVMGENANPFDHQIARERMIERFGTKIKTAMSAAFRGDFGPLQALGTEMGTDGNGLVSTIRADIEQGLLGGRKMKDTEFFSNPDWQREHIKQMLNRVDLMTSSLDATIALVGSLITPLHDWFSGQQLATLEAGLSTHRVARAIEMQNLNDPALQEAHLQATRDAQDARIRGAQAYENDEALPADAKPPTTNSLSEASPEQIRFVEAQSRQLAGQHGKLNQRAGQLDLSGQPGGPLRPAVPQSVNVDFAQIGRPAASKTATLGTPGTVREDTVNKPGVPVDKVKKKVGTFGTSLQAASMPQHVPMGRAAGMKGVVKGRASARARPSIRPPRALGAGMRKRIDKSVRDYTVESQFFHYPLRWPVTGQPQYLNIVPGVQVPYNVLNKPGNVKGAKHEQVDPIEALYANIGCARAEKFPSELLRAVVTEAAYKPESGVPEPSGEIHANGSKGVLTEIFSASASERVAAQFNLPISGFGAVPRDRSQRLDLVEETGVNVASMSDLAQAEVILMPGGVFTVKHVDPNAGKPPRADGEATPQDIGQVVYLEQQDTYQLEKAFDDNLPYLKTGVGSAPAEGTLMVHPETGQFMRYEKDALKAGDKLYDPTSGKFVDFDASNPPAHGGFKFVDATRNYFLGKSLEFASTADQQALWRHPYTGDSAKRSTKDAIHAAILRGVDTDPIVSHLDEATQNLHHEHFRRKGGFYDTRTNDRGELEYINPRAQAEAEATAQTKLDAAKIVTDNMAADLYDKPQTPLQTEMLAWTTASMLRTPIQLVPVGDDSGLPDDGLSINQTYDKVDMLKHPLEQKPDPAVVIGVGKDGYYAMRNQGGKFVATHRISGKSDGRTAENFMQAYLRAGPLDKADYAELRAGDGEDKPSYVPGNRAAGSGRELYAKLGSFAATDYIVLQEALVARKAEAESRAAHGSDGDSDDKGPAWTKPSLPSRPKPAFTDFSRGLDDDAPGTSISAGAYVPPEDVLRETARIRERDATQDASEARPRRPMFSRSRPTAQPTVSRKGKERMPGTLDDAAFD